MAFRDQLLAGENGRVARHTQLPRRVVGGWQPMPRWKRPAHNRIDQLLTNLVLKAQIGFCIDTQKQLRRKLATTRQTMGLCGETSSQRRKPFGTAMLTYFLGDKGQMRLTEAV
jgi:hypothetical protein